MPAHHQTPQQPLIRLSSPWAEVGVITSDALRSVEEVVADDGWHRDLLEGLGDQQSIAFASITLGTIAYNRGDSQRAQALLKQSLIVFSELGDRREIAECLELLAGLASTLGLPERAARLYGSAEALIESIGLSPAPTERYQYERNVAAARARLDEAAFAAAWAEGRAMPLEQAIASARAGEDAAASGAAPPAGAARENASQFPITSRRQTT